MQQFKSTFEDYAVSREDILDLRKEKKKQFLTPNIICYQFGEEDYMSTCVSIYMWIYMSIEIRQLGRWTAKY